MAVAARDMSGMVKGRILLSCRAGAHSEAGPEWCGAHRKGLADLPLPLSCNGKSQGPGWDQQGMPCRCFEVFVVECDMPAFLQQSLVLRGQQTAEWLDMGLPGRKQA